MNENTNIIYMKKCIKLAKKAQRKGDIPVGCLIVDKKTGKIVSKGYNEKYQKKDSTLHAEIVALKKAYKVKNKIYLDDCIIYVSLEPCLMCLGAIINSRIKNVVVGTLQYDDKKHNIDYNKYHIHIDNLAITECQEMLSSFFKSKRRN